MYLFYSQITKDLELIRQQHLPELQFLDILVHDQQPRNIEDEHIIKL